MSQHHHHANSNGKNLIFTILLNLVISIAQLIGGIISGSMALISDSVHNFSDVLSLIISYLAHKIAKRPASLNKTYGFARAEIVAAFINSASLIIISAFIIKEAFYRLQNPGNIEYLWVIGLAALGIMVNAFSVILLNQHSTQNMNIKSAYLHLMGDLLTSIAVLLGGFAMYFFQIWSIDAILSVLIAIYLIYSSFNLFVDSLKVLMQFSPQSLNLELLASEIMQLDNIQNIHHIHVWQLNENELILEAHIDMLPDKTMLDFEATLDNMQPIFAKYHIKHFTIQPELNRCMNKDIIAQRNIQG